MRPEMWISWTVTGIVVPFLWAAGLTVFGYPQPELLLARGCFILGGVILLGMTAMWAWKTRPLNKQQIGVAVGLVFLAIAAPTAALTWMGVPQAAAQSPIINNAPSINTFNQSGGSNTINVGPPRRPEGLYQSDQMVGMVGGAKPGPSPNQVIFQNLRISSGTVDLSAPLEFQNAIVRCPLPSPRGVAAMTTIMMAGETTCDIVGQRQ